MNDNVGILVHGDNHFIVDGPRPDRATALALTRQWSIIQIGGAPSISGWTIRNKAFREDLGWAVVVATDSDQSPAVKQLLKEMAARGVEIQTW